VENARRSAERAAAAGSLPRGADVERLLRRATAAAAIASCAADVISFGIPFIANPDLVRCYAEDATPRKHDPTTTLYGDGVRRYTDYAALA
jgi:N-ethylmaleimide reductase